MMAGEDRIGRRASGLGGLPCEKTIALTHIGREAKGVGWINCLTRLPERLPRLRTSVLGYSTGIATHGGPSPDLRWLQ